MSLSLGIGLGVTRRGGGVASGPVAPAGAAFAVAAHPSCCRSDAANTIPCGPGDGIRWWRDLVTGTWYEQATSGARLILRDAGGGKWYAENDGTRYHDFTPLTATSFTAGAAVRPAGSTANNAQYVLGGNMQGAALGGIFLNTFGFDGTNLRESTTLDADGVDVVCQWQNARIDRGSPPVESAYRTAGTLTGLTVSRIGNRTDTLINGLIGRLYAVAWYDSNLGASGRTDLAAWLRGYMP